MPLLDLKPSVDSPAARLGYDLDADARKPVLILAHSLGVHRAMWAATLPALRRRWRVLSYDLRGHGESTHSGSPLNVEILGTDVVRMADQLGLARFAFCGVSLGGLIGQWLGIHAAERIDHLFLANTAMKFGEAAAWNSRIDLVREQGLAPVISGTLERWFTAEFRRAQPHTVAAISAMLEGCAPTGYLACCAAVRDADFRSTAAGIHALTLVLGGSFDPVSTPADSQALAEQIPGAQYVEIPAAHLSAVECPEMFAQAMLDFAAQRNGSAALSDSSVLR